MNPQLQTVVSPPIAEADSWLPAQENFPHKPLLNLAQGVPSYPPAQSLRQAMAEMVLDPANAGYTAIRGLTPLREALANHLTEIYRGAVSREQVVITAGCNQAFCAATHALAAPGDEVILTTPYYFNHHMWLTMQGIKPVLVPCGDDDVLPSPQAVSAAVSARTRAIVLVSPNNPTGAIYPPSLLSELLALAARHHVSLVLDETYKDFIPDHQPPHSLFAQPSWYRHFVSLHSFSKSYSLTGQRIGAIVAAPELLGQIEKVLDTVTICPSHWAQRAALFALNHLDQWRDERTAELNARRDALVGAFTRNDLRYQLASAGGFFAYVRHPFSGVPALKVAQRLAAEQNLLALPGSMFGPGQDAYLRFSFTNVTQARFPELIDRLLQSQA